MTQPACIKRLIEQFRKRSPMRATSLIVTVFGDTVSPHGGTIWLGSLVNALAPLGVDDRLVRTSVFRLVKDGWLESEKIGRKSFYRFTDYGLHEYQRVAHRIYGQAEHQWNGNWQMVIPRDIPEGKRELFRRSLHWQGFRSIAAGVFARPDEDNRKLLEAIEEFGLQGHLLLMNSSAESGTSDGVTRSLVQECWKLDEVATRYKAFIKHYTPLHRWLAKNSPKPDAAFAARTLMIHDYRRILLQDTPLPDDLLPPAWPGERALGMTSDIYRKLTGASIAHITSCFENEAGAIPQPAADFFLRFEQGASPS